MQARTALCSSGLFLALQQSWTVIRSPPKSGHGKSGSVSTYSQKLISLAWGDTSRVMAEQVRQTLSTVSSAVSVFWVGRQQAATRKPSFSTR